MDLIYFSPVPWNSYTQRPHEFVKYLAQSAAIKNILWVNPFPTRLPRINDLLRRPDLAPSKSDNKLPMLTVINVPCLPVEPLPILRQVNSFLWKRVKKQLLHFSSASSDHLMIAIGKPNRLGLWLLKNREAQINVYDRMDDFSHFYSGLSKLAMKSWEQQTVKRVNHVMVSERHLALNISHLNSKITVVENGYDMSSLPVPEKKNVASPQPVILGYAGSIAKWFDWELTIALANNNPDCIIRLIGPCFVNPPPLPNNIELRKACPREELIEQIKLFSIGIIPFKNIPLSQGVDPIKFYEYRGLGKPVLSTRFGSMPEHAKHGGVVFFEETSLNECVSQSLNVTPTSTEVEAFRIANDWSTRFEKILPWLK
ncbi:MAG: glycosyl transferase [Planctomycetes bacterium]|nr:glycosyl transferase [Planctomycetota bacterium]MCH9723990.1 glycosyl transferase [Planctomycetota bacterium]MCH9774875.1 glycosyl transferase [Planctomycetota bacterium]MCH9793319.1 glycosyl transferase [Planctomycetota bacterium]